MKTHGKQAMILEYDSLSITQVRRDPPSLVRVQYYPSKLRIDRVRLIKSQTILRHHVQLPSKHAEGFAVHRMRMAGGVHVRTRFVDFRMDSKGCCIDRLVPDHHSAFFVYQNKI